MHESVRDAFAEFSRKFEGYVHFMYLDIKGLVTIGIGNLIDAEASVRNLPFTHKLTRAAATQKEILAEWRKLKRMPELAQKGHKACEAITDLRLSDEDIAALVERRLLANEALVRQTFREWDDFPADAQLGVMSLAWAVGAAFAPRWPRFTAACHEGDWAGAAANSKLKEQGNPGVIPRNRANALLFGNALEVVTQGLDRSRLFYPDAVPPAVLATPAAST